MASRSALLLAFLLAAAGSIQAQNSKQRHRIDGFVISALTGEPVFMAAVEIPDLGIVAFTDEEGYFSLGEVRQGLWRIRAANLGYVTLASVLDIDEPLTLTIELDADPILLEEIEVTVDRLAIRRSAAPFSSIAFDQAFLRRSAAFDAAAFVRRYSVRLRALPATGRLATGGSIVTLRSNQDAGLEGASGGLYSPFITVRRDGPAKVFIDDWPQSYRLSRLQDFKPDDLYMIEIYDMGRIIQVYTPGFIERLANGEARPLLPVYLQARF